MTDLHDDLRIIFQEDCNTHCLWRDTHTLWQKEQKTVPTSHSHLNKRIRKIISSKKIQLSNKFNSSCFFKRCVLALLPVFQLFGVQEPLYRLVHTITIVETVKGKILTRGANLLLTKTYLPTSSFTWFQQFWRKVTSRFVNHLFTRLCVEKPRLQLVY